MKNLIEIEILDRRPDKSAKTLLESSGVARHVWCPKLNSPVCKIGHSDFDRIGTPDS
jgi:hypothetical protein